MTALRYGEIRRIFKGNCQGGCPESTCIFFYSRRVRYDTFKYTRAKQDLCMFNFARSVFCSVAFRLSPGSPEAPIMRFLWCKSYQGHGISILVLLLHNVRQALDAFLNDEEITMQLAIVFALVLNPLRFCDISSASSSLRQKPIHCSCLSQPTMTR